MIPRRTNLSLVGNLINNKAPSKKKNFERHLFVLNNVGSLSTVNLLHIWQLMVNTAYYVTFSRIILSAPPILHTLLQKIVM